MSADERRTLVIGGGSQLAQRLATSLPAVRTVSRRRGSGAGEVIVADYGDIPPAAFDDIHTVINCVGTARGDAATLTRVNVAIPVAAAGTARRRGCRRFIQISSLSVYGRATAIDAATPVCPASPYGRSKAAADTTLLALADDRFAVRLLRAPAIYGPGAAGKFGALARVMRTAGSFPVPLVLGRRSVLHRDNAAAALVAIAAGNTATGVDFAADHDSFDLGLLAATVTRVTARPVRLIRAPDVVFAALRTVAPGLYASLYAASVIDPAAALTTTLPLPVALADGLVAALAARWKPA